MYSASELYEFIIAQFAHDADDYYLRAGEYVADERRRARARQRRYMRVQRRDLHREAERQKELWQRDQLRLWATIKPATTHCKRKTRRRHLKLSKQEHQCTLTPTKPIQARP